MESKSRPILTENMDKSEQQQNNRIMICCSNNNKIFLYYLLKTKKIAIPLLKNGFQSIF